MYSLGGDTVTSRAKLLLLSLCCDSRLLLFQFAPQDSNFRDLSLDRFLLFLELLFQRVVLLGKLIVIALLCRTQARSVSDSSYRRWESVMRKVVTDLDIKLRLQELTVLDQHISTMKQRLYLFGIVAGIHGPLGSTCS